MTENEFEKRLNALEARIEHEEGIIEIKTIMNRYLQYFQGADANNILQDWAFERDDCSVELGRGKFQGERTIRLFFDQRPDLARLPGALVEHETTSQVVTIADDGQTARFIAFSPGYKCLAPGHSQVWSLGRYYVEFIKIEGRWKIWHMQWAVIVEGDAALGWLYQNRSYFKECLFPELDCIHRGDQNMIPADNVIDHYKMDMVQYFLPEPPPPYKTWDKYNALFRTREY